MSNATLSRIIKRNEEDANRTAANVMLLTFAIFTVIYILNVAGIFIIDRPVMTAAYFISAVLLLLPKLLNKLCGTSAKYLKYLYVMFADLFLLVITSTLTYHVVVVYAFPIAIAGLYFSQKLTKLSTAGTLIVTAAGQFIAFYIGRNNDHNFQTLNRLVIFGVLPRMLTLLSFAALLLLLTKRTSKLLSEDADNYEQLLSHNQEMICGFATLVENRDENTGGHIKRTSIYAELLSRELQRTGQYSDIITDEFIECLAMVAPLHDIGKISIPDSILCKPGKLTDEEFDIMKSHSAKGSEILKEIFSGSADENYKQMAYEVARYHHEKWNGRGYPEGLSGTDIPLSARIMAVADVFDAVSEKRCYRDAMPLEECFNIISEGSGRDFDPVLAETFLNIRETIEDVRKATHNKPDVCAK
ncbi:HD-GYP domain-containing protein [Huintestinicola sp.]|uniref:HD-GYP domain-containing protein n=1 Tax=Huintestinicola sp. TaxID=2981661 RepID=UPI003D7D4768